MREVVAILRPSLTGRIRRAVALRIRHLRTGDLLVGFGCGVCELFEERTFLSV